MEKHKCLWECDLFCLNNEEMRLCPCFSVGKLQASHDFTACCIQQSIAHCSFPACHRYYAQHAASQLFCSLFCLPSLFLSCTHSFNAWKKKWIFKGRGVNRNRPSHALMSWWAEAGGGWGCLFKTRRRLHLNLRGQSKDAEVSAKTTCVFSDKQKPTSLLFVLGFHLECWDKWSLEFGGVPWGSHVQPQSILPAGLESTKFHTFLPQDCHLTCNFLKNVIDAYWLTPFLSWVTMQTVMSSLLFFAFVKEEVAFNTLQQLLFSDD